LGWLACESVLVHLSVHDGAIDAETASTVRLIIKYILAPAYDPLARDHALSYMSWTLRDWNPEMSWQTSGSESP
jgi:hypothetical protein